MSLDTFLLADLLILFLYSDFHFEICTLSHNFPLIMGECWYTKMVEMDAHKSIKMYKLDKCYTSQEVYHG